MKFTLKYDLIFKSCFICFVLLCLVILEYKNNNAQTNIANSYVWVADFEVNATAVDGDYTYVGGGFNNAAMNTGSGVKLTTSSAIPDITFPKVNGLIHVCIPDGSGGWYIGGKFTQVGSHIRNRLARINSDGTLHPWNPNVTDDNGDYDGIYTIAVSGTFVYVGGLFTSVNGISRTNLAKLSIADGTTDLTWNPSSNWMVNEIIVNDIYIYVATSGNSINGTATKFLARLNNSTGTIDGTWNPNPNKAVISIKIDGSSIYAGGYFESIGGQARSKIARLNNLNGNADSWNPGVGGTDPFYVNTIAISGSDIYLGGRFTACGGVSRNHIAKLNSESNSADATWNPNPPGSGNDILQSIVISGSDIYVCGAFTEIGGQARNGIARLNNTNGSADTWAPAPDQYANSVAVNNNDVYVGGYFKTFRVTQRRGIFRINNTSGMLDDTWYSNIDGFADVNTIAVSNDFIYVGGEFTTIGGQTRKSIARLNKTDGNADPTWNPNAIGETYIYTIVVNGSDIYVGGYFTAIGGLSRNHLAKLNSTNGNANTDWNPNPNERVKTIAISGSDIFAGGYFTTIGGASRNYLAKIDNINGNASAWNPNPDGWFIATIAVSGSDIYVGGYFANIGGAPRNYLAKLNSTNNVADPNWNPNVVSSGFSFDYIRTIAISGSDIYVGGDFTAVGGASRNCLAKLNNTSGTADTWNPNPTTSQGYGDPGINSITISGSDIYVGGNYNYMGGIPQDFFAMFTDRPLPVTLSSFTYSLNGSDVTLKWVTNTEVNNKGFEILRSEQNIWTNIGYVKGNGTTNIPLTYTFTDTKLQPGKYGYKLKQIDYNGNYEYHNLNGTVEIGAPTKFSLRQNYPNPFNPTTKIKFDIPSFSSGLGTDRNFVQLKVYDITGREVQTLVNESLAPGTYEVTFDGSMFNSGVYFYKLNSENFSDTKKFILLK